MFLSPQMYTPTTRFTDDGDFSFAHFRFSKCHDPHCLFHGWKHTNIDKYFLHRFLLSFYFPNFGALVLES